MRLKHNTCIFIVYMHLRLVVCDDPGDLCKNARTWTTVTMAEISPAKTMVFEFKTSPSDDVSVTWTLESITKHASAALNEFYQTAVGFSNTVGGNLLTCTDQAGSTCRLELRKTLDAEFIVTLAGSESLEQALRNTYGVICQSAWLGTDGKPNMTLVVRSINEFAPQFDQQLRDVQVPECTPVGTALANLSVIITDRDVGVGWGVASIILEFQTDVVVLDGLIIKLKKKLNYDELLKKRQTIIPIILRATDAAGTIGRDSINLHVTDCDTHPPYFSSFGCERLGPCGDVVYNASITNLYTGPLKNLSPGGRIVAKDGDTLNASIVYSLQSDKYKQFMKINSVNGEVTIVKPLVKFGNTAITLTITAREVTPLEHSAKATLLLIIAKINESDAEDYSPGADSSKRDHVISTRPLLIAGIAVLTVLALIVVAGAVSAERKKRSRKMVDTLQFTRAPWHMPPVGMLSPAGPASMAVNEVNSFQPDGSNVSQTASSADSNYYETNSETSVGSTTETSVGSTTETSVGSTTEGSTTETSRGSTIVPSWMVGSDLDSLHAMASEFHENTSHVSGTRYSTASDATDPNFFSTIA